MRRVDCLVIAAIHTRFGVHPLTEATTAPLVGLVLVWRVCIVVDVAIWPWHRHAISMIAATTSIVSGESLLGVAVAAKACIFKKALGSVSDPTELLLAARYARPAKNKTVDKRFQTKIRLSKAARMTDNSFGKAGSAQR